jgi:hypothetical protein
MSSIRLPACSFYGVVAAAVGMLAVACDGSDGSAGTEDSAGSDLINGTDDRSLPATVHIADGCTAAKIGPKLLLTAAHCALDVSTLELKYGPTRPVSLSRDGVAGAAPSAVARVLVHPAFREPCATTLCSISAVVAKLDAPDIAVIELADELRGVPIAPLDLRPLVPGDRVIVEGFGCTRGVHLADGHDTAVLNSAETWIVPPAEALHEGSYVQASDLSVYAGNYALTPGPGGTSDTAGLCPGDSGGPLYARRDRGATGAPLVSDLVIVGVNANYTLRPESVDSAGLPVTNWHTRIDTDSRNNVAEWLTEIVRGAAIE